MLTEKDCLMKRIQAAIAAALMLSACTSANTDKGDQTMKAYNTFTPQAGDSVIWLAGGCFWGSEKLFSSLDGVVDTTVGYANGYTEFPTYAQVCTGNTGFKETVRVEYDPEKINLETILEAYFLCIDPAVKNQQGNDIGSQYQTGIYYSDDRSQTIAEQIVAEEKKKYDSFYTELEPLVNFYDAEDYHQDYLEKNPNGYCHISDQEIEEAKKIHAPDLSYVNPDDSVIRSELSALQYSVTQNAGTEQPFSSEYWNSTKPGIYVDIITGEPLFSSADKYDSSCGWPSFDRGILGDDMFRTSTDYKIGYARTEVESSAGNHLGHRFDNDSESPNGTRYCINGASLKFIPYDQMDAEGYSDYKQYVKSE